MIALAIHSLPNARAPTRRRAQDNSAAHDAAAPSFPSPHSLVPRTPGPRSPTTYPLSPIPYYSPMHRLPSLPDPLVVAKGYAHPERLVSTEWLAANLAHPSIRLLECNEDLLLYELEHIAARKNSTGISI